MIEIDVKLDLLKEQGKYEVTITSTDEKCSSYIGTDPCKQRTWEVDKQGIKGFALLPY